VARRGDKRAGGRDRHDTGGAGRDLLELVIDYAKQETLGPLKGLVRFAAFGVSGSLALSVGVVVLLVALLRALQTETGATFGGELSWLPYVITAGAALLVAGLAGWRITRGAAARTARRAGEGRRN
jgi:hypothetical protein